MPELTAPVHAGENGKDAADSQEAELITLDQPSDMTKPPMLAHLPSGTPKPLCEQMSPAAHWRLPSYQTHHRLCQRHMSHASCICKLACTVRRQAMCRCRSACGQSSTRGQRCQQGQACWQHDAEGGQGHRARGQTPLLGEHACSGPAGFAGQRPLLESISHATQACVPGSPHVHPCSSKHWHARHAVLTASGLFACSSTAGGRSTAK